MRVQMATAPAPYGIDNVVYGSAPAAYGAVATTGYRTVAAPAYGMAAGPAYGPAAAPAYRMAAAPAYSTVAAPSYRVAAAPAYAAVAAPSYGTAAYGTSPYGTVAATGSVAMAGGYPGMAVASPAAYPATTQPYTLDSGDRLRVVIFGQDGLTNSYVLDASGDIAMPLIGSVAARGLTTDQLSARIADLLRQGYVRDPHVAVEIEAYRPFFILGEVAAPGQYPYVPNMSVESAVAIAGGFSPRAQRDRVTLTHTDNSGSMRVEVPLGTSVSPGDTVLVGERWF